MIERQKILIVDDVVKNIQILGQILRQEQYDVAYAMNGRQALDMLSAETFDLILLDVMMPEMNGYEVCSQIRANPRTRDIPIIFLTAKADKDSIVLGFQAGGEDYITKPFHQLELMARVKTHLELRAKRIALEHLNAELETKVAARTAELSMANAMLGERNKALDLLNSRLAGLDQAKTDFLGLISHELNTPLNGIIGITGLLEEMELPSETRSLIPGLRISADRLLRLASTALMITKLRADQHQATDGTVPLDSLVESAVRNNSRLLDRNNIIVKSDPENTDIFLTGDYVLLNRCLASIIDNAARYSQPNSTLTIASRIEGNLVCVTVADEGPGFSKLALERLFEMFATDNLLQHHEGFGLSMAAAKLIMTVHQGEIRAGNLPDKGAFVSLFFRRWTMEGQWK